MKITSANLMRWAGLSAIVSGSLFVGIQAIHPQDVLASIPTPQWTIVHLMGVAMGITGVFGLIGIYARQVERSGWLGLVGYLLLSIFYMLTMAFQFIEAFLSPVLANVAPSFVVGFLGIASGHVGDVDMGALPVVYALTGMAGYMLGGLLFGIATFRAGVLPRWAGALLAVGVVLPLITTGLIVHPYDRILALPVGVALAWLGYALWSERRAPLAQPSPVSGNMQFHQTSVK